MKKYLGPAALLAAAFLGAVAAAFNPPFVVAMVLSFASVGLGAWLGVKISARFATALVEYEDAIGEHADEYENAQYRQRRTIAGKKKDGEDDRVRRGSIGSLIGAAWFLIVRAWETSKSLVIGSVLVVGLLILVGLADSPVMDGARNGFTLALGGCFAIVLLDFATRRGNA